MFTRMISAVSIMLLPLAGEAPQARMTGTEAIQKEVLEAVQQITEAQAACNTEAWRAGHTKDWTIVVPNGQVVTADEFLKNCKPVKPAIREQVTVRVYGADAAVVLAAFRLHRPDGTTGSQRRLSQLWVRQDGKWLNAHSHVTPIQSGGTAPLQIP